MSASHGTSCYIHNESCLDSTRPPSLQIENQIYIYREQVYPASPDKPCVSSLGPTSLGNGESSPPELQSTVGSQMFNQEGVTRIS
jgi:hypothetical protein